MSPKKNPSGKRGSTKKEDPESAPPTAEEENKPARCLIPSRWAALASRPPLMPERSVFEPDDEPSDTNVYRPDSTEVDTKFDRDRNRFWALKAKGWPSSADSDITSPHDSIVGDKTPFTHGSDMPPAPLPDKNDTAGSDQKHPDSLGTPTPNPEDVSIFSPEHPVHNNQRPNQALFPCDSNRHRNHRPNQTEERFDSPVTEDHHDPRLSHLLSMRNAKPDGFADGIDELELIDTPTLEDKDDLELSQLSDWQEILVVTDDELECIDTGTPEEYQDLQLMIQLSNPQTTNSERLMTRNEKPGRLSYEQRKKLRTLLYVFYKLPIVLLLFVAAVTDAHKPGLSESGVSSSTSSRSIIWPAYLFHPLSRKRNRDDLSFSDDDSLLPRKRNRDDLSLLQDDPSRPRRSNCDAVDGSTRLFPMCHEDDCLGLNRGTRCSETDSEWFDCPCWLQAPDPRKPCPVVPPWPDWRLDTSLFFGEPGGDAEFWSAQVHLFDGYNVLISDTYFYPGLDAILHTPMGSFHHSVENPGNRHKMMVTWRWAPNSWLCEGMRKGPRFIGGPGIKNGLVKPRGSFFYGWKKPVYGLTRGRDGDGDGEEGVNVCNENYVWQRRYDGVYEIRWSCRLTPDYWIGL